MGVGLEILNDSGYVQVLDAAPILTLEKNQAVNNTVFQFEDRVYFSGSRVVAMEPADGHHLISTNDPYRNGPIDPETDRPYGYYAIGNGNIHIFRHNQPLTQDNFGLEVYSENGELQFSSSQRPLRVIDFVDIKDVRYSTWSKTFPGKRVAAITSRRPIRSANDQYMTKGIHRNGDNYFLADASEGRNPYPDGGLISAYNFQALIIDVTNY
jgi:hypothetical protein